MSTPRLIALLLLAIFGGGGSVLFIRSLMRRHVLGQEGANPMIGLGPIGLGCLTFLLLWYGFAYAEPPVQFMRALHQGDEATAFSLLAPELEEEIGGLEGFAEWTGALQPQRWFFVSGCGNSQLGRGDGIGRFENGERFSVSFHLRRTEEGWVIQGITYWELGPEYQIGTSSGLDCSD